MHFQTPILFLIFNRPDKTFQVFNELRKVKPQQLYIAADGPRSHLAAEKQLCEQTRSVVELIDWKCEVKTLFRENNLGCKTAVSSAITWFFEQEEEGIILEDDCLPHPDFFRFCAEMLAYYRNDMRVMMITGDNFQEEPSASPYSYYFSNYANIWGWATWRRAWKFYDVSLRLWPEIKAGKWHEVFAENKTMAVIWERIFQQVYEGNINTWDYQWNFACKVQNGLSVVPGSNLISNIGFGAAATHTTNVDTAIGQIPTKGLNFPLTHPPFVLPDRVADNNLVTLHYKFMRNMKVKAAIKKFMPVGLIHYVKSKRST